MSSASRIGRGVVAGFAGTLVLSALMVMKRAMGFMPELDVITMLSRMMGNAGPLLAWLVHFMIGSVVWGVLYAWLEPSLPGPKWLRGCCSALLRGWP